MSPVSVPCLQVAVTLFPSQGGWLSFCQNCACETCSIDTGHWTYKNMPLHKWFIIYPIMTFAASFLQTWLRYFLTVCQNIHGGSSSKVKAGCGGDSKPMWNGSTWVYLRFCALKVRNVLGPWNKGAKPEQSHTINCSILFFARTGKNPKLHVAGADIQEGKAQKNPLVVCLYQRIPQFDTPWKHWAIIDNTVQGFYWYGWRKLMSNGGEHLWL